MKKFLVALACMAILFPLAAQDKKGPDSSSPADVSYSLGLLLGGNIKGTGLTMDLDALSAGLKDGISGATGKFSAEDAQNTVQIAMQNAQEKRAADNLAAGKAFLDSNKKKPGVLETASGLQYQVITMGKGAKPKASDTVTVNYEGKLLDGKVFDSSIARNEPATFPLDGVIPGWTEGLQLMPVGSKFRLFVPAALAYGENGAGNNTIEPNATLIFEVELLKIEAPAPADSDQGAK